MAQTVQPEIQLDSIRPIAVQSGHDGQAQSSTDNFQSESTGLGPYSRGRAVGIIGILTAVTVVSSFSTGLLTVGLPRMAKDLNMPSNLLLW